MKAGFGLIGLVVALAIVGLLVKKQLTATHQVVPALQLPSAEGQSGTLSVDPNATVQQQSQQIQQQYKQAIEAAVQQAHPMPDDK